MMKLSQYIRILINMGVSKFDIPIDVKRGVAYYYPCSPNRVHFEVEMKFNG